MSTPLLTNLFRRPFLSKSLHFVDPVDESALAHEVASAAGQELLKENCCTVLTYGGKGLTEVLRPVLSLASAERACRYAPVGAVPESVRTGANALWALAYLARFRADPIILYVNCATTNPEELESRLASAAMLHRESDGKIVVLIHGVGRERGLEILTALGLGPIRFKPLWVIKGSPLRCEPSPGISLTASGC